MLRLLVFFLIFILPGCSILPHKIKNPEDPAKTLEVPSQNIIMVNARGRPVDPTGNFHCKQKRFAPCDGKHTPAGDYDELEEYPEDAPHKSEYNEHLKKVFDALDQHEGDRKILIYIHGGLNTQAGAIKRATQLTKPITDSGYFPIFINWQSSLITSYKDHLFYIRQGSDWREGNREGKMAGWASSPFYLLGDIVRAIARAPVATAIQIANDFTTVSNFRAGWSRSSPNLPHAEKIAFKLLCEQDSTKPNIYNDPKDHTRSRYYKDTFKECPPNTQASEHHFPISIGKDDRSPWTRNWAFMRYIFTVPTKLLSAPVIDTFGTSSWNTMLRSQSMLFHYDNDMDEHSATIQKEDLPSYKTTGALFFFLQQLQKKIVCKKESCPEGAKWKITLVGHSAGAIIVNQIIRTFGELPIQNVVYMSGASSIGDYEDAIFPYLHQRNLAPHNTEGNDPLRIHHLMLHEAAESGEQNLWDFPPRGSLLVWIDNFLSNPLKKQDRSMGRFVNLMGALHHTPKELKKYISIHKFPAGKSTNSPQKHGQLGCLRFWDKACWISSKNNGTFEKDCFYLPLKEQCEIE